MTHAGEAAKKLLLRFPFQNERAAILQDKMSHLHTNHASHWWMWVEWIKAERSRGTHAIFIVRYFADKYKKSLQPGRLSPRVSIKLIKTASNLKGFSLASQVFISPTYSCGVTVKASCSNTKHPHEIRSHSPHMVKAREPTLPYFPSCVGSFRACLSSQPIKPAKQRPAYKSWLFFSG